MNKSQLPQSRLTSKFKLIPQAASAIAILVGSLVLIGWMLDIPTLKSVLPGLPNMIVSTALAFVLSGVSLWLLHEGRDGERGRIFSTSSFLLSRRIGEACAFSVATIGLVKLTQYIFNWDFGWLVFHNPPPAGTSYLTQLAPNTALNLLFIGFALMLLGKKARRSNWIVQFLTLASAHVALLALIGYAYEVKSLYKIDLYAGMALHTALTSIVLCVGILFARPSWGVMKIVTSDLMGGFIARRLLLAAYTIPFALCWLILQGQQAGLYYPAFGLSLLAIASVVVLTVLIWQTAQTLEQIDSDRQQGEAIRRKNEERYRAFIQQSTEGIWRFELKQPLSPDIPEDEQIQHFYEYGYLAECNDVMAQMYGFSRAKEIIGVKLENLLVRSDPNNLEYLRAFIRSGYRLNDAESHEVDNRGIFKYFLNNLVGIVENGVLVRAWGTQRDISDRKQTQEALLKSEDRYRRLVELSPDTIYVQQEGKFVFVNSAGTQLLGATSLEELLGKPVLDFIHSEYHPIVKERIKQLNVGKSVCVIPEKFIRLDGTVVDVEVAASPFTYQGKPAIQVVVRDISDRLLAEEALRVSEAKFRRLAESNIVGIIIANISGKIQEANDAFLQMLGYTREELVAGKIRWPEITPPEYLPLDQRSIEELNQTGACTPFEKEYIRKDGSCVPILLAGALLEGSQDSTIVFVLDLSDRKRVEKEREQLLVREREARQEAETANRIKDEFLATLSHELRTPLNAMLGWTQLLRNRKFDEVTTAKGLETIDRNTKALSQLIEDVLDVSRIITGKLRLNVRPLELTPIIEAAIDTVRSAAAAKEIQIESTLDPTVERVLGDANRLQQVVWNLLTNAVKFTPKGGRVEVQLLKTQTSDSSVEIRVSDTGIGIAANFLPHVFDRFRQADSTTTRSHGGLGLGLAIVRHLIELQGGTVRAESEGEGRGATFIVSLPRSLRSMEEGTSDRQQLTIDSAQIRNFTTLQGLRVLVVDDEADARELLVTMLKEYGAEVTAVATAGEAFEAVYRLKPNVLVSDIGMPEEDGYALIRKVRNLNAEQGGQIPAVALTAYARSEDRNQALAAGFQLHVPKPVNAAELAVAIANLTQ